MGNAKLMLRATVGRVANTPPAEETKKDAKPATAAAEIPRTTQPATTAGKKLDRLEEEDSSSCLRSWQSYIQPYIVSPWTCKCISR